MTALDKFTPDDFAEGAHDAYEWDAWIAIWDAATALSPIGETVRDMCKIQEEFNGLLEGQDCEGGPMAEKLGQANDLARKSVVAILRYRRCEVDAKTVKRSLERLGAHYAACLGS